MFLNFNEKDKFKNFLLKSISMQMPKVFIENFNVKTLAEKYATPLYCYSLKKIRENIKKFKKYFKNFINFINNHILSINRVVCIAYYFAIVSINNSHDYTFTALYPLPSATTKYVSTLTSSFLPALTFL